MPSQQFLLKNPVNGQIPILAENRKSHPWQVWAGQGWGQGLCCIMDREESHSH